MALIKYFLLRIYWTYKNVINGLRIYNYRVSPHSILGERTMIRSKTEVYKIALGDFSYISGPRTYIEEAVIGKYCSIARDAVIGVSDHNYNLVTTSPIITDKSYGFITHDIKEKQKAPTLIGNDVWIGLNSIIFRGVKIGDGAVIAAGSIVTKDVEPYSIVAGVPAKHIKYRFSKEQIEKLMDIKWWDWDKDKIKNNIGFFYNTDEFSTKFHRLDL